MDRKGGRRALASGMGDSPHQPDVSAPSVPASPRFDVGRAALVLAVMAAVATWISVVVTPWAMRRAVARYDYDNVYTFPVVSLGIVLFLDVLALGLGFTGVRRGIAPVLSAAAIGIATTGVVGIFIYVVGTGVVMPRLA